MVDQAYESRYRELSALKPARPPATIGEVWSSSFARTGLDTVEETLEPFRQGYEDLAGRVAESTGSALPALAAERGVELAQDRSVFDQVRALQQLIDQLPDEQRKTLEPHRDVIGNARRRAREIEDRAADIGDRTYGLSSYATGFVAGVARQMASPVNIALMPLGGPLTGSGVRGVGMMLAREAGYGMLAQAVQEPAIASGRQALGLESNSLENILQAGVGQAAFAGVLRGGAAAFRAISNARRTGNEQMPAGLEREMTAELQGALDAGAPRMAEPAPTRMVVDAEGRITSVEGDGAGRPLAAPATGDIAPPAPDARLTAQADVNFEGMAPRSPDGPAFTAPDSAWPAPLRDVASRMEPEDFEALALLTERNAVIDGQAEALAPVRATIEAELQRVNATREQRAAITDERLPAVIDLDRRLTQAERGLEALRADPMANDPELTAVVARREQANAELASLSGKRKASPRGDELRTLISEADQILQEVSGQRESALRQQLASLRTERARAGIALNASLREAGALELTSERLVMLQAEAVNEAAQALEAGRTLPQPLAFRAEAQVGFTPFTPMTRLERASGGHPALAAAIKEAEAGPLARAFFADDDMAVALPRDLAMDRITRAVERLTMVEAMGGSPATVEGVTRLAATIDTPLAALPPGRDKPPRPAEPVRVRVKPTETDGAAPGPKMDARAERMMATVERALEAAGGDARVTVVLPDGRTVTSARELLARVADDDVALRELDACMRATA